MVMSGIGDLKRVVMHCAERACKTDLFSAISRSFPLIVVCNHATVSKKAAQGNWRITQFLDKRIAPLLKGIEVVTLEGNGEEPHGRTLLSSIRDSYN